MSYRITFQNDKTLSRLILPAANASCANLLVLALSKSGMRPVAVRENKQKLTESEWRHMITDAYIIQKKLRECVEQDSLFFSGRIMADDL
jgi:hypothetical protein